MAASPNNVLSRDTLQSSVLHSLRIFSLNCHGFNQGFNVISAFCDKNDLDADIIFLQELWLTPDNWHKIEMFNEDSICYGKSAMDLAVRCSVLRGRPYGGQCLLFKSRLAKLIRYSNKRKIFTCYTGELFIC